MNRELLRSALRQISWASALTLAFWALGTATAGVDVWTPIGPETIQAFTVVNDPSTSARLYATVVGGDLYRSNDSGGTWTRITPMQPSTPDCSPPTSPPVVQSDGAIYLMTCTGLYKSKDTGVSWVSLGLLNAHDPVGHPTNPMVLYALSSEANNKALYRTTDGGANWLQLDSNTRGDIITQLVVDATVPSRLYALSQSAIYEIDDDHVAWTQITIGLPSTTLNSLALSGSTLFVATNGFGVYKKGANDVSWIPANNGIETQSIAIVRAGGATLYAASTYGLFGANELNAAFFRSTDGGASWLPAGRLNTYVRDFAVSGQSDYILHAATRSGLATSTDGTASWVIDPDNGFPNAPVGGVYLDAGGGPSVLYAASAFGGYKSVNGGAGWSSLADADGAHFAPITVSATRSGTVYGWSQSSFGFNGVIYRSNNFGSNWTYLFSIFRLGTAFLLEASNAAGTLFVIGNQYSVAGGFFDLFVARSDDGGINWINASNGLPGYPDPNVYVGAAIIAPGNADVLYASVNNRVYKTINGGGMWTDASGGLPQGSVNTLAVSPTQPATIFAGLGDGLYRSDDGGANWGPRNPAFGNLGVNALAIERNNPSNVYAATGGGGLYRSTDGGTRFRPINNGLADAASLSLHAIAVDPSDGRNLYIGTNAGAFALTLDRYDSFVPVIEFYNSDLDHYFIASELQPDVPALDSGAFPGWTRTGQTFKAYPQPTGAAQPVCRFYIPPAKGDSHFYSASTSECAAVLDASSDPSNPAYLYYSGFERETSSSFFVDVPANGSCPLGEAPVFRLWNKRVDSNHRYTTDPATRDAMIAKGYVLEGAVMCALL